MAWIRTIVRDEATGQLRAEYDAASQRSGRVANVLQLSSLNPSTLSAWVAMYKAVMFGSSPLTRAERELVAVVVSYENDCQY